MQKKSACIALLLLATAISCSDLNITAINKNPLTADKAVPDQTLSYAILNYSWSKTSWLGWKIGHVVHHFNYANDSPAGGEVSSYVSSNVWSFLYRSLGNLQALDVAAQKEGDRGANVRVIAKTLSAMIFFDLTCIFGDVPFSEAQSPYKYPDPKFDTQEQVLDGVVAMLDEAMALADAVPDNDVIDLAGGDLLLNSDIQRWKAFANSLKIRTLMLIRNVDVRKADAEKKLVAALGEPLISEPVVLHYTGSVGQRNAYYDLIGRLYGGSNESQPAYVSSYALAYILSLYGDPRASYWYDYTYYYGLYYGIYYYIGEYGSAPKRNTILFSDNLIRGTYPDIFMLPGELDFYRAELILGGVMGGSAQEAFAKGIRSTITYWCKDILRLSPGAVAPVKESDIEACITKVGPVSLNKVHVQLWLESFLRPVISWNTVRRTGTPKLQPLAKSKITTILKRLPISMNEVQVNINAPTSLSVDTPMWFENKN